MTKKLLLLIVAIFLTGCAKKNGLLDHPLLLTNHGLHDIQVGTTINSEHITAMLGDDYVIRSGLHMNDGVLRTVIDATKAENLAFTFYGNEEGVIEYIESVNPLLLTSNGENIGQKFNKTYKGFKSDNNQCYIDYPGRNDAKLHCVSPTNNNIYFVFTGEWDDDDTRTDIPSVKTLSTWAISKIIWYADVAFAQPMIEIDKL